MKSERSSRSGRSERLQRNTEFCFTQTPFRRSDSCRSLWMNSRSTCSAPAPTRSTDQRGSGFCISERASKSVRLSTGGAAGEKTARRHRKRPGNRRIRRSGEARGADHGGADKKRERDAGLSDREDFKRGSVYEAKRSQDKEAAKQRQFQLPVYRRGIASDYAGRKRNLPLRAGRRVRRAPWIHPMCCSPSDCRMRSRTDRCG